MADEMTPAEPTDDDTPKKATTWPDVAIVAVVCLAAVALVAICTWGLVHHG